MKTFDVSKYKTASYSFLKNLNDRSGCPLLAINYKESEKESYAMHEGRVLDCLLLEPDSFDDRFYFSKEKINKDTKYYEFCEQYVKTGSVSEAKEKSGHNGKIDTLEENLKNGWGEIVEYIKNGKDKEPVSTELYDKVMRAREIVFKNSPLPDYIEGATIQKKLKWKNRDSGVKCSGIADVASTDFILDLKKTKNAAHEIFGSRWGDMARFGYLEQIAAYAEALGHDGLERFVDGFIFAVQLDPVTLWSMHKVSFWDMENALQNFNTWCQKFKFITENDLWHLGYEFNVMYAWDTNEHTFYLRNPSMIKETSVY